MNNNYYNFNPNSSFIRNVPNFNTFNNIRPISRNIGLPRISSLFSGGSRASLLGGANTGTAIGSASKLSFSSILTGAGKTLGVINQAIPVFYQVKPIWNNAKTMFRVVKEMNTKDKPNIANTRTNSSINNTTSNNNRLTISNNNSAIIEKEDNAPTFFI